MTKSFETYAIVREAAAAQFEEKLRERLFELREQNPSVEFDSVGNDMVARIKHKEILDTEPPKPSEVGITFKCCDCPLFEPERNSDGTIDRRKKWGSCPYAYMERTTLDSAACEQLYIGIKNGDIGLTFKEAEK